MTTLSSIYGGQGAQGLTGLQGTQGNQGNQGNQGTQGQAGYLNCAAIQLDQTTDSVSSTTTETAFTNTFTVPANSFSEGRGLLIRYMVACTASGTPTTVTYRVRKDNASGSLCCQTASVTNASSSQTSVYKTHVWLITATAAPGSSVQLFSVPSQGGDGPRFFNVITSPNLATNADLTLALTAQFSASTAGNSVTLKGISATWLGP